MDAEQLDEFMRSVTQTIGEMEQAIADLQLGPSGSAGSVTGSGANTQVAYWTAPTTLAGDAGMTYDAANDGLQLLSSVSASPTISIENTNADVEAPIIEFYKNSASPADEDDLGIIDFYGETSTGAKERYGYIFAKSLDVTNGDTGGGIDIAVMMDSVDRSMIEIAGYNGVVNQGSIVINQEGQDIDFRVEASGVADALQVQGSDGEITLGVLVAGVVQSTAGGILSSGEVSLTDLAGYAEGSLIIGGGADWQPLAAPGAAGYALVSTAATFTWDQTPTWTGDHTWESAVSAHPALTIENTNADSQAPVIEFYKNSASPAASDDLGAFDFYGETNTGAKDRYAYWLAESLDVTNGATGGGMRFMVTMDGIDRFLLSLLGFNGVADQGEVIINEGSQDVDFRVEGIGAVNALFVQGSDGLAGFGNNSPRGQVDIDQSDNAAAIPVLVVDQADVSEGFINYVAASAASVVNPISTWTTGNTIQGFVRIEINGAFYWMPYYDAPTS